MLDVLDLLPVPWGFFQGLNNQGCGRGNHIDLSLTILNGQSNSDLQSFPFLGGFGDVVTNFFGRQTQCTDLWGQSGCGCDLSSDCTKADDLTSVGSNLGGMFLLVLWLFLSRQKFKRKAPCLPC